MKLEKSNHQTVVNYENFFKTIHNHKKIMTIIVGTTFNEGEKGVVIATDKNNVKKYLAGRFIQTLKELDRKTMMGFLRDTIALGYKNAASIVQSRKIEIAPAGNALIAHTGTTGETHERITQLLLSPGEFLENTDLLMQMLNPLRLPPEAMEEVLDNYRTTFDLERRLHQLYLPEVRRLGDIGQAKTATFKDVTLCDPERSGEINRYLLGRVDSIKGPVLTVISETGRAVPAGWSAQGSGEKPAREYIEERFEGKKGVNRDEAIDTARKAVLEANRKVFVCEGLDYCVLTDRGVEEHFASPGESYTVGLGKAVQLEMKAMARQLKQLREAKATIKGSALHKEP